MLCSVPTHVSVKCQEVGLSMFKHSFYVSKGKKSERGNKGCKITIAHEVSILEFRIRLYLIWGAVQLVTVLPEILEESTCFSGCVMTDWDA